MKNNANTRLGLVLLSIVTGTSFLLYQFGDEKVDITNWVHISTVMSAMIVGLVLGLILSVKDED